LRDKKTRTRTQFLLRSMLVETQRALTHLLHAKPRIFGRGLGNTVLNPDRVGEIKAKLGESIPLISSGKALNWTALKDVGLTGPVLEWKADLLYACLGRQKPIVEQQLRLLPEDEEIISYPGGKPIWSRLFQYLKSLFGSLIEGVKSNSKVRLMLDFIKEYIECASASLKFIQSGEESKE
jgi:hypothetical protein